jgi:glycyl-tRNA synthetase beta chain
LLDAAGKLTNKFLVVSNITPDDASAVTGGNERVVRPRLADAKFFFDQDRKKTLASRVDALSKVVYYKDRLGTQGDRTERVRAIAKGIAALLPQAKDAAFVQAVDTAAQLAKTDLLTDMVGEFPELQGIMGGYYARHDGLGEDVAQAIEDHYKPRFAGDELPRNTVGVVVALADKLETLVGMFGIGNLPTGDKDPFALRRHALGVIRMLVEADLPVGLDDILLRAFEDAQWGSAIQATNAAGHATWTVYLNYEAATPLAAFIYDRLSGGLREQGYSAQEVEAVLALRPQRLSDVAKRLTAVRAFAALPEASALAAANKRIGNVLKKAGEVDAHVNTALFKEDAEQALFTVMQKLLPESEAQFNAGDYTASLQTLATLRSPVDAFFDDVMVNAEEMDLRLNRQGMLKKLHEAMNRVADLSALAS